MKKSATFWLRASSLLSLLFALGHTMGALKAWSPVGETDVLRAMARFHFDTEGVSRTYLDFYLGFGFLLGVYLFLQAFVLWQLAALARHQARLVRPLIGGFLVALVLCALLAWRYIFPVPAVFCLLIAVCVAVAFRQASAGARTTATAVSP